jgi:hypothetical protein
MPPGRLHQTYWFRLRRLRLARAAGLSLSERAARNRVAPVAWEQDGRWRRRLPAQVGTQRLDLVRLHWMCTGVAALQPMHHSDAEALWLNRVIVHLLGVA